MLNILPLLSAEEHERLMNAIVSLSHNNPNVVSQLEKLADIKENNPKLWQSGIKILKL
ncbi:MAG: hypothetical protein H7320_13120 [Ferruginibacter sp.]|nr:hypothetical protein [Ferruginibacter sp.]